MKIFVNARFLTQPVTGVQRYAIECSRQIKKIYTECVFVSPGDIIHKDIAVELGAIVMGKHTGHRWEQTDLPKYLRKEGSPPLFNPGNTAPLFYRNNYITLHDLAFYIHPEWNSKAFSAWYNFLVPRIVLKRKGLFTVSQTVRKEISQTYKIAESSIAVTYNGIGQSMQEAGGGGVKEKIILAVGSFNMRKNHGNLIKGFLQSKLKDTYTLAIVGDKSHVFKETGLDEAAIAGSGVRIMPHLSETELIDMYRKAEIVASLSAYEGFGIPVLEGLYFGCKVVCADIPVYKELYDKYAYFCNASDVARIADTLLTAAESKEEITTHDIEQLMQRYNYATSAKTIVKQILSHNK